MKASEIDGLGQNSFRIFDTTPPHPGVDFIKTQDRYCFSLFSYFYLLNKCSKKILCLEIICYIMDERDKIRFGMGVLS